MSCSYGPGRYDLNYEEKGIDYPIGYIRWTENRNMKTYIDLLSNDRLKIDKLISHAFNLSDAPTAYEMILSKSERFTGILIKYDFQKEIASTVMLNHNQYNKAIQISALSVLVLLPKIYFCPT